mgnify:CR=1 FL=1
MGYRITAGESPQDAVRRIVCEQADKALADLAAGGDPVESAHAARKRFKKIRGALRLVRGSMPGKDFDRENAAWRDAGRAVAALRESGAMVETAAAVRDRLEDPAAAAALARLCAHLESGVQRWTEGAAQAALDTAAEMTRQTRGRADGLTLKSDGFAAVRKGLKRVYKRGGFAGARAFTTGQPEDFHDWRKRVKYLRQHFRLLERIAPEALADEENRTKELAELLGDDHDATVLRTLIVADPQAAGGGEGAEALIHALSARSVMLRAKARPLFQQVYAERPRDFADRIGGWWEAWVEGSGAKEG